MTQERKKLVELKNVSLTFNKGKSNEVKAIDDVSFDIYEGEIFGLVGESGSGKTTIGRSVLKLSDIDSGTITFSGNEISSLKGKDLHDFRKTAQMIFQDPYASLDSKVKVQDIIAEGMRIHKLVSNQSEEEKKVMELLEMVGLSAEHANRNVHEFSGGQRQRIGIARLALREYDLIIADEITASLDPETAQQVMMNLLSMPCMVVAITHDQNGAFIKSFDVRYRIDSGVVVIES